MKFKLLVMLIVCTVCLCAVEKDVRKDSPKRSDSLKDRAYKEWEKVKKIKANYEKQFKLHLKFEQQWKQIDKELKVVYTEFLECGNYHNAMTQLAEIKKDLLELAKRRNEGPPKKKKIPKKKIVPCPREREDREKSYQANRARYTGEIAKAIPLFYQVAHSTFLNKDDKSVKEARNFIQERKNHIESTLENLKYENLSSQERDNLFHSIQAELAAFDTCDKEWVDQVKEEYRTIVDEMEKNRSSAADVKLKEAPGTKPVEASDREEEKQDERKVETPKKLDTRLLSREPADLYPIAMDVWQSAWGEEFNETSLKSLIRYLKKNEIQKINLNPGLPMGPKFYSTALTKLQPLVNALYSAGIKKINFLYAELNYPIEYYAKFLHDHPGLKMNTLVDDSEFTDIFKDRFRQNIMQVKKWGIKYSAFITLESVGNSGVSDDLRYWALDHVDYPILMSYFGCTLEQQKKILEKYLTYADGRGKRRSVGIAILLGNKRVGREVSCERLLDERQLQTFLFDLHRWAVQNHPSYGGIVIETNLKIPRVDIYPDRSMNRPAYPKINVTE